MIDRFQTNTNIKRLFIESLKYSDLVEISTNSEILCVRLEGFTYKIFFKNISHAGKGYPENSTRAQLPYRNEFDSIACDDIFLFLGYDSANDVFVCWDPIKTKSRLNQRKYVSFFSRLNIQNSVKTNEILTSKLSNGDVFVVFKRSDTFLFLSNIVNYFPNINNRNDDITHQLNKLIIDRHKSNYSNLEIISECMRLYGAKYPQKTYAEWSKYIKQTIENSHL